MKRLGFGTLPLGGIVGQATLINVKRYASKEEFARDQDKHFATPGWYDEKAKGFVLKDAKRLPTTPLKGQLNFFNA